MPSCKFAFWSHDRILTLLNFPFLVSQQGYGSMSFISQMLAWNLVISLLAFATTSTSASCLRIVTVQSIFYTAYVHIFLNYSFYHIPEEYPLEHVQTVPHG